MPVDLDAFKGTSFAAINRELTARTGEAVSKVFPMATDDGKLEVRATNVKVDAAKFDPYDLNAWQHAREQGETISAPVTADLALYREGKRVQTRSNAKIGELPLMGSTGTFMVGGNDFFTPAAQFRLKPGIYSRQKTNGEYEAFMPMQGASMTVWMDPAKGRFKLSHGSTNVDLYPVLKALGTTDEQIVQSWGGDQRARELLEQNKVDKGEKDIDKLFESVFHLKQNRDLLKGGVIKLTEELTGVDHASKIVALKQWMDTKWLDPYVTKKTVGTAVDKPNDAAFLLASKKILGVQRGEVDPDDRDSPHFKTAGNVADLLAERIDRNAWRIQKKLFQKLRKGDNVTLGEAMGPNFLNPLTAGYFGGAGGIEGGLAHTAESANPLAMVSEQAKTTFMGPGGIQDMHAVTKGSRMFRPGSLGFVDPSHTPEGSSIGLNVHLAGGARKVGDTIVTRFIPVVNGRAKWDQLIGLTVEEANDTTIGYPEFWDRKSGEPIDPYTGDKRPEFVRANRDNEILEVAPNEVKYILPNGQAAFDFVGNAAGFFANTHPTRGMMAGKHVTQALPLIHRELPLATPMSSTGADVLLELGHGSTVSARNAGTVTKVAKDGVWVDGVKHAIFDRYPMQAKVAIDHTPVVKVGDVVKKGDLLADSNYTLGGKLALGINLRSAYIPWKNASNYEDAIVISEGAAAKLTSDHTHRHELILDEGIRVDPILFIAQFPTLLTREMMGKLGTDGVVREGQDVKPGDVLIAAVRPRKYDEYDRTAKNLSSLHKMLERPWLDSSVKWDEDFVGHVNRIVRTKEKIEIHVQTAEPMRVGDKLSMGSAAKGTIAEITPDHEMPTDEKGRPIEVIFNPHGVAGRINPSQTLEQAVGKLVRDHDVKFDHVIFGDNKVAERVQGLLDEHKVKHEEKLFDPVDGRFIENPVPVGYNYVYKLDHPVRKKFSARTRDGYTMDESPTAGRGKGGQSFDGLQTYALLGHNAHAILGESMGVRGAKNDDYWVAYQAGEKPPAPKVPFVFEKMRAMMAASGIDSQQHGNALHFMPMTDANTLKRSNGEIQKASLVRAKDLAEEKGGLFDVATTGGLKGCFSYDTLVQTDAGPLKIGDIVRSRAPVRVLSFDLQSQQVVYRTVTNWFEYKGDLHTLKHATTAPGCAGRFASPRRSVTHVTPTHKYLDGKTLTLQPVAAVSSALAPVEGPSALDIFYGMMLGDAHVRPTGQLNVAHCVAQTTYLRHKFGLFKALGGQPVPVPAKDPSGPKVSWTSDVTSFGHTQRAAWYSGNTKIVPADLSSVATLRTLAYWFMDDGSCVRGAKKSTRCVVLCTESFTRSEVENLAQVIRGLTGAVFRITRGATKYTGRDMGWQLRASEVNASAFLSSIAPFVLPEFRYKLGGFPHVRQCRHGVDLDPKFEFCDQCWRELAAKPGKLPKNLRKFFGSSQAARVWAESGLPSGREYQARQVRHAEEVSLLGTSLATPEGLIWRTTSVAVKFGQDVRSDMRNTVMFDITVEGTHIYTANGVFVSNSHWTHIDLGRKVPHPLYEKVIKDLLDIKTSDYLGLIGQTRHYNTETGEFSDQPGSNTSTGEAAFRDLLDFDPVERFKEVQAKARTASGSDLNRLNRAARYLKGLQDVRQKPFDAYMVSKVPVIPPMYRPVIEQRNGALRVADANLLYRDMLLTRDTLQKGEQEGSLSSQDLAKARVSLYDAFGAMVGVGKSLTHRRDADLRGFVDVIKGKNNKEGLFQQQLSRRRNDYTGRSTIESDATLGPDEAAIPEDMAWKIYQPAIVRRLAQLGWKPADALREVEKKGLVARNALDEELRTRPILLNRAPSLHRWAVLAAMPKLHSGKEVRISPFILGPLNADMDGDQQLGVVLLSHPVTLAVKGSPMAARFRSSLPVVTEGHVVSFVDLEDVPHGNVRALIEGKNGKIAFFDAAPDIKVLVYDAKSAGVLWAAVDGWSEHYDREIEIVELSSGYQIVTDDDPRAVYGRDLHTLEERRGTPTEAVGALLVPRVVRVPSMGEAVANIAVPSEVQPRWDYSPIHKARYLPDTLELTRSLGYALGVFVGDGWDSGPSSDSPNQVNVCGNDPDVRQAFNDAMQKILPGIVPGVATFSKSRDDEPGVVLRDSHTPGRHGTVIRDTYCSAALARLFKLWCGHGARNKQLPPWYLAAPEEFRRGLLGGLMDTDGSLATSKTKAKAKPQVIATYTSISLRLVREVRLLAQSLGIRSRITPTKYKKQGAAVRTERAWQIGFSTVDIVQWGGVDLMCERKKAKIRGVTCDPDSGAAAKSDLVPLPPTLAAALSVGLNKVDASAYVICRKQEGYCSRSVANRLIEIHGRAKIQTIELGPKWLAIVADINVTWDRVESVQKTGIRETGYDLTVPGYETFMNTDGVILSNTMSVFAPLSDRGRREAMDLLPSRNLWYDKDRSLAFAVDKDVITGLFALTRRGINSGKSYPNRQAAMDAYKNNKDGLRMDSLVMIDDEKNQNLQAIGWLIFEGIVPARFLGGIAPPIDGQKLKTILERIAKDSPADFNNLGRKLQSAGFSFAARAGGIGGTVQELAIDRTKINALLNQVIKATRQGKTVDEKRKLALESYAGVKPELDKIITDHLNTVGLGGSVFLAAKPSSKLGLDTYRQMVASPVMVTDDKDRAIPSVIKSSYGGGMLLSDYIMATPGARAGMVDKGLSVAGPGFLTKELAGNLGPVRIEIKDCETHEGLEVPVDPPEGVKQHDADLLDRHLLNDVPNTSFRRNDVVTPGMLARLRDAKVKSVMVRSPLTCEADSPPCQMCAGRTPDGKVHPIGANIGYNYGMTIGERSTQLMLRKFHSGGTIGAGHGLADGFARLRELLAVPETVKGQGTLADVTGSVTSIKSAPQGGHYIQILPEGQSSLRGDHTEHYVLPGRNVSVVQGENVKRGDRLSDGSYRPQEIAEKQGLLAAQSYVVDEMRKAFQSAGAVVRKPVLEVAVAAMMRFMRITNDGGEKDLMTGQVLAEQDFKKRQLKNPKIQGVPELPGLSHVPLVRSNDMLERLNFQRLEDTMREIPAQGGVSDLSGAKSPIPGFAYGAAFRPGQASYELTKDQIPMGDSAFNRLAHFT